MAVKGQRKRRPSWFQKQVEKNGSDFLMRKNPLEIQREALNIVRDIVRDNITEQDYQYLFDLKVLSNVRLSIYTKCVELHVYDSAMTYVLQSQFGVQTMETMYGVTPDNFQQVMNSNKDSFMAYSAVLNGIDALIAFTSNPNSAMKTREAYLNVYSSVKAQLVRFRYFI